MKPCKEGMSTEILLQIVLFNKKIAFKKKARMEGSGLFCILV